MKATIRQPLSAAPAFTEDMRNLGDRGIASIWLNVQAFSKKYAAVADQVSLASMENTRSGAIALRAGDDNIELAAIAHSNADLGEVPTTKLGDVSAGSVFAVSVAGTGQAFSEQWPAAKAAMAREFEEYTLADSASASAEEDFDDVLEGIEEETGFRLPEDFETLYGDKLTLVVGDANLNSLDSMEGPDDVADLDAALALESSSASATELARRLADEIESVSGIPLVVRITDNGAILATNEGFAKNFNTGKKLADTDGFRSVIDDGTPARGGMFVDLDRIVDIAHELELPVVEQDLDQLEVLQGLGLVVTKFSDRVSGWTLRLSFN